MRDRMERLVFLRFAIGCTSQSSIGVIETNPRNLKQEPADIPPTGESSSGEKMKNTLGFLPIPKPNISFRIHKLIKSFKSFSQLFVYKEEDEEMEIEVEMEIGFPTDVEHVTHIGWDGSTTTNPIKGWDKLKAPELLSLPSISLRQFEIAMAAQNNAPPFVVGSSNLN
ncbi:hypothetical protein GIB67_023073 [Kingdonia uniflora]|uniref:CRIB domain-containing protein n=1 Tax=Kingdonia uniflora TaxID=39325 RepID=A0A7J7P8A2_9MAGN|nr:hypothetical protein GIB67_023073 [Kingdonia uniflora]